MSQPPLRQIRDHDAKSGVKVRYQDCPANTNPLDLRTWDDRSGRTAVTVHYAARIPHRFIHRTLLGRKRSDGRSPAILLGKLATKSCSHADPALGNRLPDGIHRWVRTKHRDQPVDR